MGFFSSLLGGAAHDVVFVPGAETILMAQGPGGPIAACPAFAAVFTATGRVAAAGEEAQKMRGKEPPNVKVVRVTKQGGFPDLLLAIDVMRYVFRKHRRPGFAVIPPRALFVCLNSVRREVKEVGLAIGAREVVVMPPQMAAALGADLAIERPEFTTVFVLERDWCAFGVISLSNFVVSFELTWGVDQLLEDGALHALATRGVVVDVDAWHERFLRDGLTGAELPGWEAWLGESETGRGVQATLGEAELRRSARPFALRLDWQQRTALAALPGAKARDAAAGPVHFFGPYARVPGLAALMEEAFHRLVVVAPGAESAMARGAQNVLRNWKRLTGKAR
jgi:MreB/Mbl protein